MSWTQSGFARSQLLVLPRKVRTIPCATQRELDRFFGPWNGWLYKRLADERARGAAPPQEEAFAPFAERVRCE